jgi:Protein of unknown function (DUF3617)
MQLRDRYPSLAGAALVAMIALAAAPPAAAQGKDDLWEVSSKMEMPGMPMAMPAQVNRVCVGKNRKDEDLIPRQENCRVVDSKRVGNRLTYRMECTGNEPSVIVGDLTFGNNAYDGQMRMTMTKTNDTMNMALSGRRVGDCTAPAR